jgi:hypothetical protein
MKERILTGWTFTRLIFLLLGGYMVIESAITNQWAGVFIGSYFASMGLFRFGCAAGSCFPTLNGSNAGKANPSSMQDVEYEEVKAK